MENDSDCSASVLCQLTAARADSRSPASEGEAATVEAAGHVLGTGG